MTDSCSDLDPVTASVSKITVVPLYVNASGVTYRDGVDIGHDRFYQLLDELPGPPTTSQPSPADFERVYRRLLDRGYQVVSIHVSSRLRGTYDSACQARRMLDDPLQVEVVDSQLAGGAQALLTVQAARLAERVDDHLGVARRLPSLIGRQNGYFMLDTLKCL